MTHQTAPRKHPAPHMSQMVRRQAANTDLGLESGTPQKARLYEVAQGSLVAGRGRMGRAASGWIELLQYPRAHVGNLLDGIPPASQATPAILHLLQRRRVQNQSAWLHTSFTEGFSHCFI